MDYITIKGAVRKWDWCKAFAPRWGRKTATGVDMFILEWHWRFSDSSDKESQMDRHVHLTHVQQC